MKIIKTIDLPCTNNSWGFGGARNKKRYILENGDVWVSGIAGTRHHGEVKYIQLLKEGVRVVDSDLQGSPETFIAKYYKE